MRLLFIPHSLYLLSFHKDIPHDVIPAQSAIRTAEQQTTAYNVSYSLSLFLLFTTAEQTEATLMIVILRTLWKTNSSAPWPTSARLSVYSVLLSFIFLFFRKDFPYGLVLPHDILCTSRSDDNRRTAGAVGSSAFGIHYNQTNLHLIDGPAARHLFILCVLWTLKC